ncbi:HGH1-like protein [Lamellibrachia satsuma]|nr:HGH1-like protein [Lamellibrachia satsuma]
MSDNMNVEQIDREILPFLSCSARADVKAIALQYFFGLTGSKDGCDFVASNNKYLSALVSLTRDSEPSVTKDAFLSLVNLSTDEQVALKLLDLHQELPLDLLKYVLDKDSRHAGIVCMLLSNISRSEQCARLILNSILTNVNVIGFDKLVDVFCQDQTATVNYLGPFFSNLMQIRDARHYLLDKKNRIMQRLLPFIQYEASLVRRGGIVGTIRNCCFESSYHDWLLGDDVDILPRLLLPLAGPEEFDEEDTAKLPVDLQYLEADKKREADPDVRKMLLESINQLCSSKSGRKYIRDKNAYVILRELHSGEKDPAVLLAAENLISVLISDEPASAMEDLRKVEIPQEIEDKLQKAYELQQREVEEETQKLEAGDTQTDT